jgi:HD-GYP domain-containing protein (c-di-GMP phosphodiesterase class II)
MYIQLEVGWMRHPFPVNSFRIVSDSQLQTVKALGLDAIRYFPARSEIASFEAVRDDDAAPAHAGKLTPPTLTGDESAPPASAAPQRPQNALPLHGLPALWQRCDERFRAAAREYMQLFRCASTQPEQALATSHGMVQGYLQDVLPTGDLVIRLLSESSGHRQAEHPVNVTVLCLLLGRALGMNAADLYELGLAALLHDISKDPKPGATALPRAQYERHVGDSVALAMAMGVSSDVLTAMAQHHEFADGSGFPLRLIGEDLSAAGKVLCLVNAYDRLCNPEFAQEGQTPHEALSVLYAQYRERFDATILKAFIRMMGVYPPGSVVQLADGRFAMVVSVNSSRPLKPQVLVYDAQVPLAQALPLDLEMFEEIGIRRSLRPDQLPREALSYLSPRQRICYFFERAVEPCTPKAATP